MWYLDLPVDGRCPECGQDFSSVVRIQASPEWVARYQHDKNLAWGVNRSVERRIRNQHERVCTPQRRHAQSGATYAATA